MPDQSVNPCDGKPLSSLGIQKFVNQTLVRVADTQAPASRVARHA